MKPRAGILLAAGAVLALLAAANWHSLLFLYAGLADERRPALLEGVGWDKPGEARAFRRQFPPGTAEATLIDWLEEDGFSIYPRQHRALRHVARLPCNEEVEVSWSTDRARRIQTVEAVVRRAGCR